MFDLTQMEIGREYKIGEIPGFSPVRFAARVVRAGDPLFATDDAGRAFIRGLCDAVRDKTVAATYLHVPTGVRYDDLQVIPDTYGDPVEHTGIDDIRVLFWRLA